MKKLVSFLLICSMLLSVIPAMAAEPNPGHLSFPFTDVPVENGNGYLNVKHLYDLGIISGKTETTFAPNDTMTREEVAKVITLAAKMELTDKTGTFADVESGSWYEKYVETVNASGLMIGIGNGLFGTGEKMTRQDVAVLLVRFANYTGIALEDVDTYAVSDLDSAAAYAKDAIDILISMNVIDIANNKFNYDDDITRIDFCKYLDRLIISDARAYDDVIQKWMPQEKEIDEYDNDVVVLEDFEDGLKLLGEYKQKHNGLNALGQIVKGVGKDSDHSLHLTSQGQYTTIEMYLEDPDPSTNYGLNWDCLTKDLGSCFVRLTLQWCDANGVGLSGQYVTNFEANGTYDWRNYSHMILSPTPDLQCKYLRIMFVLHGVTKGEAWIDNLKIYKLIYEPITTYLKLPAYKGLIYDPAGESDIRLTNYITGLGSVYPPETTKIVSSISDLDGNVLMKTEQLNPTEEMDVTFSSKDLAVGDYDLAAQLYDTVTGRLLGENHYMIRKREPDYRPKMYFDEEGRLIKDGKPWFPQGVYALGPYESVWRDMVGTPLEIMMSNSVGAFFLNYDEITEMGKHGISAMVDTAYNFQDSLRRQYQNKDITTIASERAVQERFVKDRDLINNPGFLAYGINNESGPLRWGSRMGWHNQIFADIDLDHPTYGVSAGGPGVAADNSRMQDIYACDEPYPITGAATDAIWEVWEKQKPVAEESVNRPVWACLQISDLKLMGRDPYLSRERGPNEEELRNMAWQSIAAGVQGLIWYSHFHMARKEAGRPYSDTMAELVRVSEEVDRFEDVILSREDTPDLYQKADIPDRISYGVRRYEGKTYVFLVNTDRNPQTISVKLEDATSIHGAFGDKEYKTDEDSYVDVPLDGLGVEVLIVEQPEPKSADCQLKNIHFSNGEKNYFVSVVEDGDDAITVAECATKISYNVSAHKDATIKIDGDVVPSKGTLSLEGKDKITLTIVSEDGKHSKDYVYNIIRVAKEVKE